MLHTKAPNIISNDFFKKLLSEFEFEGKRFYPIIKIASLALSVPYNVAARQIAEISTDKQIVIRFSFKYKDNDRNFDTYYDKYFYFDTECNYFLRPNENPKNMTQIFACLVSWGFIEDLHLKMLDADLI